MPSKGVELVFHEGALGSVPRSIAHPQTSYDVNVMGTLNLLGCRPRRRCPPRRLRLVVLGLRRHCQVSPKARSASRPIPSRPTQSPSCRRSKPAACSPGSTDLETVALRYFNVFGAVSRTRSRNTRPSCPKFLTALSRGERPTVFGDGEQSRGFTYVENVVNGNLLARHRHPGASGTGHQPRIRTGPSRSTTCCCQMGEPARRRSRPHLRAATTWATSAYSLADIARARELLGFDITVSFDDRGSTRTVEAFVARRRKPVTSHGLR